jgi:hypothetical protein
VEYLCVLTRILFKTDSIFSLLLFHRLPDNGFPFFRIGPAYIRQINLVVFAAQAAAAGYKFMHVFDGRPFWSVSGGSSPSLRPADAGAA